MSPVVGTSRWFANERSTNWSYSAPSPAVLTFHRSLDGYAPTPLVNLPELATELGVALVLAKDESRRFGLPAFKALGASWAIHQALQHRDPGERRPPLLAATDGNHGRAVARFARLLGHAALIWVPVGVHPAAVEAIRSEGATVTAVDGSYDVAVAAAARAAVELDGIVIQDTSWDGYEQIPNWIVEGYATMFLELDEQLSGLGLTQPGLVVVPVGVGSLAQAAISHYRGQPQSSTALLSVEPASAACVLASLENGSLSSVETGQTIMAGLNCGTPSALAWPLLRDGLDGAASISDDDARRSIADLGRSGLGIGPCGAASLAGARSVLTGDGAARRRAHLGIHSASTVVLLLTEGQAANPG